jgi:hypothetical protein
LHGHQRFYANSHQYENYVKLLFKKFTITLRIKLEQNNKVCQDSREQLQGIQREITNERFQLITIKNLLFWQITYGQNHSIGDSEFFCFQSQVIETDVMK